MKKIPSMFPRDLRNDGVYKTSQVNPGIAWVFNGEGIATQKFDGTACMVWNGVLYRRHHEKRKASKSLPKDAIPCQGAPDPKTGDWPFWVPAIKGHPDCKYHFEVPHPTEDGTYELCGPGINGNPERLDGYKFIPHGSVVFDRVPLKLNGLVKFLKEHDIEGIVWHHPDGRMVKVTKKGFGLKR